MGLIAGDPFGNPGISIAEIRRMLNVDFRKREGRTEKDLRPSGRTRKKEAHTGYRKRLGTDQPVTLSVTVLDQTPPAALETRQRYW